MNAMLGDLPTWNLSDLYSSPSGSDLDADLKRAAADADSFAKAYEGKVAGMAGQALGAAVAKFEALNDLMGRIGSYASLYYAQDMADPERGRFSQDVSQALTDIGAKLVFFRLEINKLDDADLAAKQKDPALAKYGPWLRDLRAFRPHQLSDEIEKALHEKCRRARRLVAPVRRDDRAAALPFRNEVLTEPQIFDKLSSKDAAVRKDAAKSFGKVQGDNVRVFSLITNTLAKDKEIEDRWRNFERPHSSRNLANQVEDEVVDALSPGGEGRLSAALASLLHAQGQLVRRRHACRTGTATRHCPRMPTARSRGTRPRRSCSTPTAPSRPSWPHVGQHFFGTGWIDAPVAARQGTGAFAHPDGAARAPLSAAELPGQGARRHDPGPRARPRRAPGAGGAAGRADGRHAAHPGRDRLGVRRDADLPGAAEPRPTQSTRKALLAGKVEDMLNTVVRQIAFCEFEARGARWRGARPS